MKLTNETGLPAPLYAALLADDYDAGASDITATGLLQPPHKAALERAHDSAMSEDVADMARLLIGKAVHHYIARVATGELDDKKRLAVRVADWVVSGQTDHVFMTPEGGEEVLTLVGQIISDYKTMSVNEWRHGLREEREQQLNIYAELLRANGYAVSALRACCIFVDWNPRQARMNPNDYPPRSIVDVRLALWPQAQAQAFILDRVLAHQAARRGDVTECSDEERWARGGEFAVVKNGVTRAKKLHATEADALAHAEALNAEIDEAVAVAAKKPAPVQEFGKARLAGLLETRYHIEERGKEYARCENYCAAGRAGVCAQWNEDQRTQAGVF